MRFRDHRTTVTKNCPAPKQVPDDPEAVAPPIPATPRRLSPFDEAGLPQRKHAAVVFRPTHNRASRRAARGASRRMNLRRMTAAIKSGRVR